MIHKILKTDWVLLSATFLLLGVSLAVLYSLSTAMNEQDGMSIFAKQAVYVLVGIGVMLFFAFTNYQALKSYSTLIYFSTLFLLILVLIFGTNIRGTAGWIGFGPFHIQPVEISKLSLIIFLASFISQKKMELEEIGRMIASVVLCGIMILLVIKQPDFGSAMVLLGVWGGMTLVSGISKKLFGVLFLLGVIIIIATWFSLAAYQKARVLNLFNPNYDPKGSGYNVLQSTIAVGSGGIIGKGIGHGSQSQLNFLPEKHTDFIYAATAEELGLVGSLFVLALFGVIFYRIQTIARHAPDNFGYLLAVGVLLMIFWQVLENVGMNIGLMPVTGIPLPLMSYGGSSLITMMAAIGILCNIHAKRETFVHID